MWLHETQGFLNLPEPKKRKGKETDGVDMVEATDIADTIDLGVEREKREYWKAVYALWKFLRGGGSLVIARRCRLCDHEEHVILEDLVNGEETYPCALPMDPEKEETAVGVFVGSRLRYGVHIFGSKEENRRDELKFEDEGEIIPWFGVRASDVRESLEAGMWCLVDPRAWECYERLCQRSLPSFALSLGYLRIYYHHENESLLALHAAVHGYFFLPEEQWSLQGSPSSESSLRLWHYFLRRGQCLRCQIPTSVTLGSPFCYQCEIDLTLKAVPPPPRTITNPHNRNILRLAFRWLEHVPQRGRIGLKTQTSCISCGHVEILGVNHQLLPEWYVNYFGKELPICPSCFHHASTNPMHPLRLTSKEGTLLE